MKKVLLVCTVIAITCLIIYTRLPRHEGWFEDWGSPPTLLFTLVDNNGNDYIIITYVDPGSGSEGLPTTLNPWRQFSRRMIVTEAENYEKGYVFGPPPCWEENRYFTIKVYPCSESWSVGENLILATYMDVFEAGKVYEVEFEGVWMWSAPFLVRAVKIEENSKP